MVFRIFRTARQRFYTSDWRRRAAWIDLPVVALVSWWHADCDLLEWQYAYFSFTMDWNRFLEEQLHGLTAKEMGLKFRDVRLP